VPIPLNFLGRRIFCKKFRANPKSCSLDGNGLQTAGFLSAFEMLNRRFFFEGLAGSCPASFFIFDGL